MIHSQNFENQTWELTKCCVMVAWRPDVGVDESVPFKITPNGSPDCDCSHSACCGKISFYNHIISYMIYHFIIIISIKISYHCWLFLGNRIRLDDIPECMSINAYISSSIRHLPQLELTLHFAFPGEFPLNLIIGSADSVCVHTC